MFEREISQSRNSAPNTISVAARNHGAIVAESSSSARKFRLQMFGRVLSRYTMRNPSIISRIICVPASSVPTDPSEIHPHASCPGRVRNCTSAGSAPGGNTSPSCRTISSTPPRSRCEVATTPNTSSIIGKNARNMLKAMACDCVMQSGTTRLRAASKLRRGIACDYTGGISPGKHRPSISTLKKICP